MKIFSYIYIQLVLGCMLFGINTSQLYSQKIIKVGVIYTSKAASSILPNNIEQKAKNQINIINEILQQSGISDLELEVSYTKLHTYEEPKYRKDGYIRFSFDGTYQMLDELSNHASLMDYFVDNNVNSFDEEGTNYIDQDELSQSLISINASTKTNVVLFIADEDGPPIISEYIPQYIKTHTSRTFFSVVNAKAFSNMDIALALGFFGVFIDDSIPDLDADNKPSNSSFLSYWEYDDVNVERKISNNNKEIFKCSLSKLNLQSPIKMEIGGVIIETETKNSVMDVEESLVIVPASPVNKRNYSVIAPDGDEYSLAMVSKRQRINDPICISANRSKSLYYSELSSDFYDNEEYIDERQEEFDDIDLFTPEKIKVYPNPTNGLVTFEFVLSAEGDYKLALFTSYGQQVMVSNHILKKGLNKIKADYRILESGMYVYRLTSQVEKPISGKLILK